MSEPDLNRLSRWRLALGKGAERHGINLSANAGDEAERMEEALDFTFADEAEQSAREQQRVGSSTGSRLTIPRWIDEISELFPRQAKELLERELVGRRGIRALLESPEVLDRVEPSIELVEVLITHKDLLNEKTRALARKIIDKVVGELREKLEIRVERAIVGALRRDRHSPRRIARNLDLKTTVRRNLKNWDSGSQRLLVDKLFYFAAEKRRRPWHIIVCVDQSGSMLESAVFAAVMASIFAELPSVRTSLVLFDTEVVDLTDKVGAPVDVLLSVQLGGGTDIAKALGYCAQLTREPARTIVVLITDFDEGGDERSLVRKTQTMAESGIRMIGLGALGYDARPTYNRVTARKLRRVGMDILACTPETLTECMAKIIAG